MAFRFRSPHTNVKFLADSPMKAGLLNKLTTFMDQAIAASVGIELTTTDVEKTKRYLYKAMKILRDKGHEKYSGLKIITPPKDADEKLWIVRNHQNDTHE